MAYVDDFFKNDFSGSKIRLIQQTKHKYLADKIVRSFYDEHHIIYNPFYLRLKSKLAEEVTQKADNNKYYKIMA